MITQRIMSSLLLGVGILFFTSCSSEKLPLSAEQGLAKQGDNNQASSLAKSSHTFPEIIPLPDGFRPEGVATGRGTSFYVGSLEAGAVFKGDLRTGMGELLVEPEEGKIAVGMYVDERSNRLFVAGGGTGNAWVYDADTGEQLAMYTFSTADNKFINDVVVTRDAAYFTNSFQQEYYRVPLGAGGALPGQAEVETIPLGGEYQSVDGFNTNGIDATPDGKHLIVVNSSTGTLYTVEPVTGDAMATDLGGEDVTRGDGILLDGKTLYVLQNMDNQIAVVRLNPDLSSGEIVERITHPAFDVPTTLAEFGSDLYAVNAKFGTDPEGTPYEVVRVSK